MSSKPITGQEHKMQLVNGRRIPFPNERQRQSNAIYHIFASRGWQMIQGMMIDNFYIM